MLKVRNAYTEDYNAADFALGGFEPVLTKQSDAAAADINVIVRRWQSSGVLPTNINDGLAQFADVSELPDYRGCLDLVMKAQKSFGELSSAVRERFANDPAKFLDFVGDPANYDEMVKLGLAVKREVSIGDGAPSTAGDGVPVETSQDAPASPAGSAG